MLVDTGSSSSSSTTHSYQQAHTQTHTSAYTYTGAHEAKEEEEEEEESKEYRTTKWAKAHSSTLTTMTHHVQAQCLRMADGNNFTEAKR